MQQLVESICNTLEEILANKGKSSDEISLDDPLYDGGLGLDSLDAAELSVGLERAFGYDPYTAGQFPETVADIVNFYSGKKTS